jgi:hypothetical protein
MACRCRAEGPHREADVGLRHQGQPHPADVALVDRVMADQLGRQRRLQAPGGRQRRGFIGDHLAEGHHDPEGLQQALGAGLVQGAAACLARLREHQPCRLPGFDIGKNCHLACASCCEKLSCRPAPL